MTDMGEFGLRTQARMTELAQSHFFLGKNHVFFVNDRRRFVATLLSYFWCGLYSGFASFTE